MNERELRRRITELKSIAAKENIDIHGDLSRLSKKISVSSTTKEPDAWRKVEMARHPERPTSLDYISLMCERFMELHGDRHFADDPAIVSGIGEIGGYTCMFICNQKGRNMKESIRRNYGMAHPEGYRKALRLGKLAEKYSRPIITLIDTSGAYPGITSEERGISEAIARNLKEFSALRVPVLVYVLGEGGSGGALGIGVGDQVIMMENAIYSVISPEGCASILLRDAGQAKYAASLMKMTAQDLLGFGVIDGIINEPPGGTQANPELAAARLKEHIVRSLKYYTDKRTDQLLRERSHKILNLGIYYERPEASRGFLRRLFGNHR